MLARWSGWGAVAGRVRPAPPIRPWPAPSAPAAASCSRDGRVRGRPAHHPQRPLHRRRATCQAIWARCRRAGVHRRAGAGAGLRVGELHRLRPARAPGWSGWSWTRPPRRSPQPCTRTRDIRAESFADTRLPRAGRSTRRSATCRSAKSCCTTAGTTRAGTRSTTTSSSRRLHLTRPGGLVAVLTSRYTMDAPQPGRPAGDGRRWPTWSARCGCRPGRTAAPPAPSGHRPADAAPPRTGAGPGNGDGGNGSPRVRSTAGRAHQRSTSIDPPPTGRWADRPARRPGHCPRGRDRP